MFFMSYGTKWSPVSLPTGVGTFSYAHPSLTVYVNCGRLHHQEPRCHSAVNSHVICTNILMRIGLKLCDIRKLPYWYCDPRRHVSVSILTRVRVGQSENRGFISGGVRDSSLYTYLDWLWDPPILFSRYLGSFPRGESVAGAWSWPLTLI
jgi:hypothetical protein